MAKRAKAFGMKLIGFDPYISPEAAVKLGVRLMPLDKVCEEADFITVHAALTPTTHNLVSTAQFNMMKPTVMIVNCARGGIIDEAAWVEALKTKRIAGSAIDVFEQEPLPKDSPFLGLSNAVLTPHLGASTKEAQEKVSIEMAEHVKMFLVDNKITNAVNAPMSKIDPKVAPFIGIAERLGSFCMQLVDGPVKKIEVEVHGEIANMDTRMVTVSALVGVLSTVKGESTNIINAGSIAREMGIQVVESKVDEMTHLRTCSSSGVVRRHQARGAWNRVPGQRPPAHRHRRVRRGRSARRRLRDDQARRHARHDRQGRMMLGNRHINIANMNVGRETKGGQRDHDHVGRRRGRQRGPGRAAGGEELPRGPVHHPCHMKNHEYMSL